MIIEFKTKVNRNGNKKYIGIDTEKKIYTRMNPYMVAATAITIDSTAYKAILEKCIESNYTEVDRI